LDAISAHYGSIGWLVDNSASLFELIRTVDATEFARRRPHWIDNLKAIRKARSPQVLAKTYRTSIAEAKGPGTWQQLQKSVENSDQIKFDIAQSR
jgi:hypothetical protein